MYAEVLSAHLESYMTTLKHHDQTGFIILQIMCCLLHVVNAANDIKPPCAVFSLDAEKALDRLVGFSMVGIRAL